MAPIPPLGADRRRRPTREHGPLRLQQLLRLRLLARLASLLQPLDRALRLRAPRRRWQPRRFQQQTPVRPIHPSSPDLQLPRRLHLRRPLA